jgi:hypothetical protein
MDESTIAIMVTIVGMIAGMAKAWGAIMWRIDAHEDRLDQLKKWSGEHFEHEKDTDAHFNPRERDDLSETMKRVEILLAKVNGRRGH